MAKMNEYPSVDNTEEFTQEQKAAFLGSAMCIATGSKTVGGNKVTANIPLSDITPAVPTKLSDLTDDITVDTYDSTSEVPISGKGVAAALGNFGGFQVVSLTSDANPVPDVASPSNKLIYLTKETSAKKDPYTEWIYTGNPTSALDVSKWEVIGETTVDLSDYYTKGQTDTAISNALDSIAPEQNSVLYGGGSGGVNKPMDVRYDNTLTKVSGANGYELKVAVPVPSPGTNVHRGEVLTVNNSDEAVWAAPASGLPDPTGVTNGYVLTVNNGAASWAAPAGGGGGGNPYTKTTLAAQDATANGHKTDYSTDFFDQTISINNNSYTIVSNVAYAMVENPWYNEEYDAEEDRYNHEVVSVENFTINLVQTDFPMAVVEFTLDEKAAVVNINVNNGVNPLSRMYSTPYVNSLMPDGIDSNGKASLSFDTGTIQAESNYYYIKGIYPYQLSENKPSLVTENNAEVYTKVQIKIFGDAFTVLTNTYNANIPAS